MQVLLITSSEEDYLQDSIIHGFKELFGKNAIDYPVKDILYNDYKYLQNIRGNGFTLYGLLDNNLKPAQEIDIENSVQQNKFDLIIFTSIYRQHEIFYKHYEILNKRETPVWIMDGEDTPILFPYLGKHLKQFLFSLKPHNNFLYFKRELLPESLDSIYFRFPISKMNISYPKNIQPISFSIPLGKIIDHQPAKTKLFTRHIIDEEVAEHINGSSGMSLFSSEEEYYTDIQNSKFGVTTKRAGWDCLRHYEIAANGAIICFKNLQNKPKSCAPHGLINGKNCISYSSYFDLMKKIHSLSPVEYQKMQIANLQWVKEHSTIAIVKNLLMKYYQNN